MRFLLPRISFSAEFGLQVIDLYRVTSPGSAKHLQSPSESFYTPVWSVFNNNSPPENSPPFLLVWLFPPCSSTGGFCVFVSSPTQPALKCWGFIPAGSLPHLFCACLSIFKTFRGNLGPHLNPKRLILNFWSPRVLLRAQHQQIPSGCAQLPGWLCSVLSLSCCVCVALAAAVSSAPALTKHFLSLSMDFGTSASSAAGLGSPKADSLLLVFLLHPWGPIWPPLCYRNPMVCVSLRAFAEAPELAAQLRVCQHLSSCKKSPNPWTEIPGSEVSGANPSISLFPSAANLGQSFPFRSEKLPAKMSCPSGGFEILNDLSKKRGVSSDDSASICHGLAPLFVS